MLTFSRNIFQVVNWIPGAYRSSGHPVHRRQLLILSRGGEGAQTYFTEDKRKSSPNKQKRYTDV